MGEMLSMIAHQWRQPLSAISASSAVIYLKASRDKLDKDTAIELSNKIKDFSQHLSSTIDDFRDFFKTNKKQSSTNFSKILDSVLGIVSSSLEQNNITLKLDDKSHKDFETYENELKQVLLNLIKNAEDALVENSVEDATINVCINDNILFVKDNAGGISEDIIDKIFDPYFSTKTKKDGTGLGLYMSKTIIEEHCNGKFYVENEDDGAKFTIIVGDKDD
jgi:signal transduction histidine kinase